MNKYLVPVFVAFVVTDCFASISLSVSATGISADVTGNETLAAIKDSGATSYTIHNANISINNFSDWQNWNADVNLNSAVCLYINHVDTASNGTEISHISNVNVVDVIVKDPLYKIMRFSPSSYSTAEYLVLIRETDYSKVFKDSRGTFLENIRLNHPDDKMLSAMDKLSAVSEMNSVMNSAYHFNPMILMNPIKTLNRAVLTDFISEVNSGFGADFDYIFSDKTNNYGGHIYVADKYKDSFFKIGLNLNRFSYSDNFNDFDGMAYGLDIRAKQYVQSFWFDGIFGVNRSVFNADNIYVNGDIKDNPKGLSEYARLSIGYDIKHVSDFVLSPFAGLMFQKSDIMGLSDSDINLHTGITGKYNFVMDGIKYEYGASIATDEKANWNIETKIGFVSVVDNAGAYVGISAFRDEFATNYKLSVNAKICF